MQSLANFSPYDGYKSSNVEWNPSVPVHWTTVPMCAVATIKSISNCENEPLLSVYLDKGVIRFDEVDAKRTNATSNDLSKYQLVEPGDFVLNNQQAWRGSVGVSAHRGIVSPAYLVLSLSSIINPSFGNYLFRDGSAVAHYLISSKGVGTIQRNLYWPQLKRTPVILPQLHEQTLIAKFLDQKTAQIDEAIAIKEQQIKLLQERKQIIIQKAVTQGLDPNLPMKDSGVEWIGQIPEHWEVKKIKMLTHIKNGIDYKHVESDSGYPVYGSGGQFTFSSRYLHSGEAVLLGRKGTIDKPIYVNGPFWTVDTMFYAICNKSVYTKYLYFCATTIPFSYYSTSTALPSMTQTSLLNHKLAIPNKGEQLRIIDFIEERCSEIDASIDIQRQQMNKFKEYKAVLINSAVTGKIKVTPDMVEQ